MAVGTNRTSDTIPKKDVSRYSLPEQALSHRNDESEPVQLMERSVGSVTRICKEGECLLTPINHDQCSNINGPFPLRTRSWMHPVFREHSVLVYYSSHLSKGLKGFIHVLGGNNEEIETYRHLGITLDFSGPLCQSYHSPSLVVDDTTETTYMYVHGHMCRSGTQPTVLFQSRDGVAWTATTNNHNWNSTTKILLNDLFYMTAPIWYKDAYYALAETQENSIGSAVLLKSSSLEGPFLKHKIVAQGLRHVDVHLIDSTLCLFYTLIGDMPERIMLSTIDLEDNDLSLLPGPTVLTPIHEHEHGNAPDVPSSSGASGCGPASELRDPHFLPDRDVSENVLSGLLFYAVQGERAIAMARILINIEAYTKIVQYRDHKRIHPDVLEASSLERNEPKHNFPRGKTLITGVGRTGTTYLCTFFNALGLSISHDNNIDCGVYPGNDGAVSWYDAFDHGKRYQNILHVVRNPLDVIQSRAFKMQSLPHQRFFLLQMTKKWEDDFLLKKAISTNSTEERFKMFYQFSLHHWVNQNSFVQNHSSWRERIEDLSVEPLADWRLCMAGMFGERCPDLRTMREHLQNVSQSLNSLFSNATISRAQAGRIRVSNQTKIQLTWGRLQEIVGEASHPYVAIARQMSAEYGYKDVEENNASIDYVCGFEELHWKCTIL